jgi:hypothetical protein
MILKPVLEPVVFGGEADQDARRPAMPSDHDLFTGCQP